MEVIRDWISNISINTVDEILPIHQIYCWLITEDNNIIIVSKDWIKRQLPWWKPNISENALDTLLREVYEETWINIDNLLDSTKLFGYYRINENWEQYLQLRFILRLPYVVDSSALSPNEVLWEEDHIKFIKIVPIIHLSEYIPRLPKSDEFKSFTESVNISHEEKM